MNVEAAIFDLDGTLVCLPINYEKLFEDFRKIMRVNDVRPLVDKISKLDLQTRHNIYVAWDQAEVAVARNSTICEEGPKLYHQCRIKPNALVTLQGRKVVDLLLSRFHFSFDVIVTREDSLFRTEQLKLAITKLKVPEGDTLFIANTEGDARAAKAVGCQFLKV